MMGDRIPRAIFVLSLSCFVLHLAEGVIDNKCLNCICKVEGCRPGCHWDVYSYSCGPYQIKEPYWIDCGRPGSSFRACANDFKCAANCVRAYMNRYGTYCTRGRTPTCQDYARIHNGGPLGCRSPSTIGYWNLVAKCYYPLSGDTKLRWINI